ncbi:MAG: hypothetical protein JWQ98_2882 [Chlorobi bacterium]|nr:hypothetical protein [Chlorobiota bacterium]
MSNRIAPAKSPLKLASIDPRDTSGLNKDDDKLAEEMAERQKQIYDLHYLMYADNRRSLLIILQGIDASGKDGAVRYLAGGFNPQGLTIHSFKRPSDLELDHDYLWRVHQACPGRGEVAIFNRSHYEEVTVAKIHPEILAAEFLPTEIARQKDLFQQRYRQIRDFERMLAENGTVVLKLFLHISRDEQVERLEERMKDPRKHWKFSRQDLVEREFWDDYMRAFEEMIDATGTEHAPWYIIPADRKWYRNLLIGRIVAGTMKELKMEYPALPKQ